MNTLYRAQILLEAEQHQRLAEIARSEDKSLSQVVREIVGQYLVEAEADTRLQNELLALSRLAARREALRKQHGTLNVDLLAEVREEREAELNAADSGAT